MSNNDIVFTYTDVGIPIIDSISPTTSSPVLKADLTINGSNFGTDSSKLNVWLMKDDEFIYELNI